MQAREIQGKDYSPKLESMGPSVVSPWKKVLRFAVIASLLVLAVPMALEGQIIPPIAIYMVLALAGLSLMQRKVRVGAIVLAVVGILFLLANLPFIIPALSVPASMVDFLTVSLTIICLIGVVVDPGRRR